MRAVRLVEVDADSLTVRWVQEVRGVGLRLVAQCPSPELGCAPSVSNVLDDCFRTNCHSRLLLSVSSVVVNRRSEVGQLQATHSPTRFRYRRGGSERRLGVPACRQSRAARTGVGEDLCRWPVGLVR